jgi:hypothetical protein
MFHLQICRREWVLWGHGPRPAGHPRFMCNISPAVMTLGNPPQTRPFEPFAGSAEVYERVTMWGWRFRGENELSSTKWGLAETREEALKAAEKFVQHKLEHMPLYGRTLRLALGDVQEYDGGIL